MNHQKSLIGKLFGKTYWFFKHLVSDPVLAGRRLLGYFHPPLLCFQMGKVGSSSIKDTIESDYRVYHLHTKDEMGYLLPNVERRAKSKIDIVTATRDPIGREISVYFQNLLAPGFVGGVASQQEALEIGVQGLIERFHMRWKSDAIDTAAWFDRHFEESTGVDIYSFPFDKEKGWQIVETEKYRILVLRFEDIRSNYLEALNTFVAPRFGDSERYTCIRPSNISDAKWYAALMKDFKREVSFDSNTLESAYQTKYMEHFYKPREIAKMRSKFRINS